MNNTHTLYIIQRMIESIKSILKENGSDYVEIDNDESIKIILPFYKKRL